VAVIIVKGYGIIIKTLKNANNMKKQYIIVILYLFANISKIAVANASIDNYFLYNTYSQNNEILYFDKYDGTIYKQDLSNGSKETIFDLIPSDTDIVQISPDKTKMLIYTSNISYPKYNAPFFDSTQKSPDKRWWIYDFNTQNKKILNAKINLATWYSENEIVYVFDNKDISIAPVNNLNDFNTLYSKLQSTVDTNKLIIANAENQIVPLKEGYIIGSNNKFKYIKNNNYNIVANPNLDIFLEYNNNQVKILDWSGNQKLVLENLSIKNTVILNNTEFIVLLQNSQLVKYNLQKQELARVTIEPTITNIYPIGESDNSFLIQQDNTISLYNINTKEKGVLLSSSKDTTPNPTTPVEAETTSNNSNILLLIGGILFLVAGVGVFIWKLRRR